MRVRPTARLLVIDDRRRLLLFHIHDLRPAHVAFPGMAVYWVTPGGGVDPGESFAQAARRELWEETGIAVAEVGPCVWHYERLIDGDQGLVLLQEQYFLVEVPATAVHREHMLPYERDTHRDHRWWSGAELARSGEPFVPALLPQAIGPLLAGAVPPEPLRIAR